MRFQLDLDVTLVARALPEAGTVPADAGGVATDVGAVAAQDLELLLEARDVDARHVPLVGELGDDAEES